MGALDAELMRKIGAEENAAAGVITQDGTPETVWDAWPGLDAVDLIPIEKWKIGRASCRERVCSTV